MSSIDAGIKGRGTARRKKSRARKQGPQTGLGFASGGRKLSGPGKTGLNLFGTLDISPFSSNGRSQESIQVRDGREAE